MNKIVHKTVDYMIIHFLKEKQLPEKVIDTDMRKKYAYLEAWVSIIGNIVLALIKVFFGMVLNSISLLADAAHTASDILTSVVVLLGFKLSSSPADEKHPYGHGRIEFLASLLIAVMLMIVGIEFGKSSYVRFVSNIPVKGSFSIAAIMVLGGIFKEWMSQFSIDLGTRINASSLIADAWHHRTDGIASFLVAVAIVASRYGYYKVDAIFGFGVSALIVYTGINIAKDSSSKIIGEEADKEELEYIKKIALSVSGVTGIHKIHVHDYGSRKMISLHIQVESSLSLIKAHDIAEQVERAIEAKTNSKVLVHVEPLLDLE